MQQSHPPAGRIRALGQGLQAAARARSTDDGKRLFEAARTLRQAG